MIGFASGAVMLAGQVITGGSVSLTVTLKPQEAVLPFASIAMHATAVVPFWNVEPLAGVQLIVAPQLSPALAE